MKLKYILLPVAALVLLASCYKDKGSYDYNPMNDIEVDIQASGANPVMGDTMILTPKLTFKLDSNVTDLQYRWTFNGRKLCDEKKLFWIVDTIGKGNLVLNVTDPSTGVTYLSGQMLTISSAFEKSGWIVLSEKNGVSSFSFFREFTEKNDKGVSVTKLKSYPDIYKTLNHEDLGTKPVKVLEHFCDIWEEQVGRFWVIQEGGQGCVDVSGSTFLKEDLLSKMFLSGGLPAGFEPYDMIDMIWITLAVSKDGKIYHRKKESPLLFNSGYFLDRPLTYENKEIDGRHLILAPFSDMAMTVMFDEPNKRYLAVVDKAQAQSGQVMPFVVDEKLYQRNPDFSRLDNIGDKKFLFCGPYKPVDSYSEQGYVSLLQDPAGQIYIHDFIAQSVAWEVKPAARPVKEEKVDFSQVINGTSKNVFNMCRYEEFAPYLLISKDNELWFYNRSSEQLKKLHVFDSDITAIDSECYRNRRIGVGLANGDFYMLDLSWDAVNGLTDNIVLDKVSGLGKVVHIRYKVQSGNDWGFEI